VTPEQWARVLRAGERAASTEGKSGSAVNALSLALEAMAFEAEAIAEEERP
jgi:hypothetical protein